MSALLISQEKSRDIISKLKHYYLNDFRPFAVGMSGGKDSTVTVDLVVRMLLEIDNPTKTVFVQFSDTLMEMDNTIDGITKALDRLEDFAKENNLPIIIRRVKPVAEESFFSLIIGKGYQLPSELRWCTDRLKLRPQNRLQDEFNEEFPDGMIAVVGSRKEESSERAERLTDITIDGIYKTHDLPKWNMLAPIEDLSTDDVWEYIFKESSLWVDEVALSKVYEDASDDGDECRTTLEGESGNNAGCGKSARYGCWICPKIRSKDATLNNLSKVYSYMKKQEVFRTWLIAEGMGWKNRRNYRNDNQGKKIYDNGNHRDGMIMPSGYTMEFRKEVLTRLWKLSQEIKSERGSDLISFEELVFIQNEWIKEGDIELSVEAITGVKLDGLDDRLLGMTTLLVKALEIKPKEVKAGEVQEWFETTYKSIGFLRVKTSPRFFCCFCKRVHRKRKVGYGDSAVYE